MPLYEYKCKHCGAKLDVFRPIVDCDKPWKCHCGKQMHRMFSFHAVSKGNGYRRHIVSDSLAMNPSQIPEHKRLFPDIEVTPAGQPVFDNYKKHDEYLKKINMVKQPQKKRIKSKKATRK